MEIELAEALWVLGKLPAEALPEVACEALAKGADGPALRQLAGLQNPTRREVDDLFERALAELGRKLPSKRDAGLYFAKNIASKIISGEVEPYEGARQIWMEVWNECGRPEELTVFVGLADGYEDEPQHQEAYRKDIIDEAKKLVSSPRLA